MLHQSGHWKDLGPGFAAGGLGYGPQKQAKTLSWGKGVPMNGGSEKTQGWSSRQSRARFCETRGLRTCGGALRRLDVARRGTFLFSELWGRRSCGFQLRHVQRHVQLRPRQLGEPREREVVQVPVPGQPRAGARRLVRLHPERPEASGGRPLGGGTAVSHMC